MSMMDAGGEDAGPGGAPAQPGGGGAVNLPMPPPGGAPPAFLAATARPPGTPQVSNPGMGNQGDAITKLTMAQRMINEALPGLLGHPAYTDALKAAQALSKHAAQGAPGVGVQATAFGDMQKATLKNQMMQKLLAGGGGQQGGGPAMQQAGNPATPFPGA
jgi:hypothetical protein